MRGTEIRPGVKPRRRYIAYRELEDTKAGVWRIASKEEREKYLPLAADLMKNPQAFLEAMRKALIEWPLTSNFHLSNPSLNRQAWIGHAGCCIGVNSPEEVTRLAWHTLNSAEQDEANRMADMAIEEWETKYGKAVGEGVCQRSLWG
jgi:hypothetical protein